jgi:hypothetical protein
MPNLLSLLHHVHPRSAMEAGSAALRLLLPVTTRMQKNQKNRPH